MRERQREGGGEGGEPREGEREGGEGREGGDRRREKRGGGAAKRDIQTDRQTERDERRNTRTLEKRSQVYFPFIHGEPPCKVCLSDSGDKRLALLLPQEPQPLSGTSFEFLLPVVSTSTLLLRLLPFATGPFIFRYWPIYIQTTDGRSSALLSSTTASLA